MVGNRNFVAYDINCKRGAKCRDDAAAVSRGTGSKAGGVDLAGTEADYRCENDQTRTLEGTEFTKLSGGMKSSAILAMGDLNGIGGRVASRVCLSG